MPLENPITMNGYFARLFLLCHTAETNAAVALMKNDIIGSRESMSDFEKLNAARCLVLQASQIAILSPIASVDYIKKVPLPSTEQVQKALEGMQVLLGIPDVFTVKAHPDETMGNIIEGPQTTKEQHEFLSAVFCHLGCTVAVSFESPKGGAQ